MRYEAKKMSKIFITEIRGKHQGDCCCYQEKRDTDMGSDQRKRDTEGGSDQGYQV